MNVDSNQPFKPDSSKELEIESLISAPLVAISNANHAMAQAQTKFLLDYCFQKTEGNLQPVMIRMALTSPVLIPATADQPASMENRVNHFDVPLLTLVPLNSLAVDKINVDFNVEVTSFISEVDSDDQRARLYGKISNGQERVSDTEQQSGKLSINISAGNLPLPTGVLTIIDMYTKSIVPSF